MPSGMASRRRRGAFARVLVSEPMPVLKKPGSTITTLTPKPATSIRSTSDSASKPNLEAWYQRVERHDRRPTKHRRHHHDAPGATLAHRRQRARRDHGRRDEVHVELRPRLLGGHLLDGAELGVAGVVDDGVEIGQVRTTVARPPCRRRHRAPPGRPARSTWRPSPRRSARSPSAFDLTVPHVSHPRRARNSVVASPIPEFAPVTRTGPGLSAITVTSVAAPTLGELGRSTGEAVAGGRGLTPGRSATRVRPGCRRRPRLGVWRFSSLRAAILRGWATSRWRRSSSTRSSRVGPSSSERRRSRRLDWPATGCGRWSTAISAA